MHQIQILLKSSIILIVLFIILKTDGRTTKRVTVKTTTKRTVKQTITKGTTKTTLKTSTSKFNPIMQTSSKSPATQKASSTQTSSINLATITQKTTQPSSSQTPSLQPATIPTTSSQPVSTQGPSSQPPSTTSIPVFPIINGSDLNDTDVLNLSQLSLSKYATLYSQFSPYTYEISSINSATCQQTIGGNNWNITLIAKKFDEEIFVERDNCSFSVYVTSVKFSLMGSKCVLYDHIH